MRRIFYTIADVNNLKYFVKLKNSLAKFHLQEELRLFDDLAIQNSQDPMFFYRATPILAKKLMDEGYDMVCKLDCDQIITGDLSHIWEGDFDVAVVQNSNPREMKTYPVAVWDIPPLDYLNCGFVVMKSKKFVEHWLSLCYSPHFDHYQMKEQDLLNILVYYGDYKVKFLDRSNKWHNLISKGYWSKIELRDIGIIDGKFRDFKLVLPKNDEWPQDEDKQIACLHWAGGNDPRKMEDINIKFKPEVAKWLNDLIK